VASLHVAKDPLGVLLERLPETSQSRADRTRVGERLIGRLLGYRNPLGRLLLRLLPEAGRFLQRVVADLLRLCRRIGALLLRLLRRVLAQLRELGVELAALLRILVLESNAPLLRGGGCVELYLLGGQLGRFDDLLDLLRGEFSRARMRFVNAHSPWIFA
jgi:AcrR family transcriptional regulator